MDTLRELFSPLTPQFFDALVIIVIGIGLVLAGVRLYRDFTRPLSSETPLAPSDAPRAPVDLNDAEAFKRALEEDSTI